MDESAVDREARVLRATELARASTVELAALVRLARTLCGTSHAALDLITSTEQRPVASTEPSAPVVPVTDSLCAVLLDDPEVVVVPDTGLDPLFRDHPGVSAGASKVRFLASAPLVARDGVRLGRLCVFDEEPGEVTDAQREGLLTLAERVADVLEPGERDDVAQDLRARLDDAHADLRRANEHLRLFAGQVSHDLRTPLTAVLANAEMLATEPTVSESEDAQWMADGVVRAVHRMDAMIEEMLRYARDEGELTIGVVPLGEVVEQVLADLAPAVEKAGAEVTVEQLPTVRADAHRVYAVVRELLSNALKFARPGVAPRVGVDAQRRDACWRISVRDNGIGVAPERREAMFVLFTRADKRIDGAGIGLAVAKQSVEAHGGRMGMDATDDVGTTVWFELPV